MVCYIGLPSEPIVILGNPPWVTASALGALGSDNLPEKSNFQNRKRLDALTGKSHFDVAEWMLLKLIEAGHGKNVTVAMLIKTGVVDLAELTGQSPQATLEFEPSLRACVASLTPATEY